jgi:regulatory protein
LPKPRRSLKSRALQLLAQRDQSRLELRRKLLRHVRDPDGPDGDDGAAAAAAVGQVDALLDWLEANRLLSGERFVESRVHAREGRFGNLRIRNELARHALQLTPELAARLAETELARAAAVRARRFPAPPRDASERAAQERFLAARGFSPELVHRLMRRLSAAPGDDGIDAATG